MSIKEHTPYGKSNLDIFKYAYNAFQGTKKFTLKDKSTNNDRTISKEEIGNLTRYLIEKSRDFSDVTFLFCLANDEIALITFDGGYIYGSIYNYESRDKKLTTYLENAHYIYQEELENLNL